MKKLRWFKRWVWYEFSWGEGDLLNDTQIGRVKNLKRVIGDATEKKLESISAFVNIGNVARKVPFR